jgi:large conductance mechanosensitive channel
MTAKNLKTKGFVHEFKEFAMRGNLVDLAVGVVIGGSFGKLTSSFIGDIVMPPIGKLMGNVDFNQLQWTIQKGIDEQKDPSGKIIREKVAEVAIKYGAFVNTFIDFVIVAFVMFMVIKGMNRVKRKQAAIPPPPPEPTKEEILLTEIRDLLKNNSKK